MKIQPTTIQIKKSQLTKSPRQNRLLVVGLVLSITFLSTACSEEPKNLSIGSGGMLGNYYSVARSIARVANKEQRAHGFILEPETTAARSPISSRS